MTTIARKSVKLPTFESIKLHGQNTLTSQKDMKTPTYKMNPQEAEFGFDQDNTDQTT